MAKFSFSLCQTRIRYCNSRSRVTCCVQQDGAVELKAGSRVRVAKSIVVYHVPKQKDGVDIKGMEGSVVSNVRFMDGIELSPNYPWKVQFEQPSDKKPVKFFVHLVH